MVQVICFQICTDDNGDVQHGRFQRQVLVETSRKEIIPLISVQQCVQLVHYSLTGGCGGREVPSY